MDSFPRQYQFSLLPSATPDNYMTFFSENPTWVPLLTSANVVPLRSVGYDPFHPVFRTLTALTSLSCGSLEIRQWARMTNQDVEAVTDICRNLTRLDVVGCSRTDFSDDALFSISKNLTNLEVLSFRTDLPDDRLMGSSIADVTEEGFQTLLEECKKLRELDFGNVQDLDADFFDILSHFGAHVTRLNITQGSSIFSTIDPSSFQDKDAPSCNVIDLSFSHIFQFPPCDFSFFRITKFLQSLHFNICPVTSELFKSLGHVPQLRSLVLTHCDLYASVPSSTLVDFFTQCTSLTRLHMLKFNCPETAGSLEITDDVVMVISLCVPNLTDIKLVPEVRGRSLSNASLGRLLTLQHLSSLDISIENTSLPFFAEDDAPVCTKTLTNLSVQSANYGSDQSSPHLYALLKLLQTSNLKSLGFVTSTLPADFLPYICKPDNQLPIEELNLKFVNTPPCKTKLALSGLHLLPKLRRVEIDLTFDRQRDIILLLLFMPNLISLKHGVAMPVRKLPSPEPQLPPCLLDIALRADRDAKVQSFFRRVFHDLGANCLTEEECKQVLTRLDGEQKHGGIDEIKRNFFVRL